MTAAATNEAASSPEQKVAAAAPGSPDGKGKIFDQDPGNETDGN